MENLFASLSNLACHLAEANPVLQGQVHFYNRNSEFRGISDNVRNWIYLRADNNDEGDTITFEGGLNKEVQVATVNAVLVAGFYNINIPSAADILCLQLQSYGATVTAISYDPEAIYESETGSNLQQGIPLLRIKFSMPVLYSALSCDTELCLDTTC